MEKKGYIVIIRAIILLHALGKTKIQVTTLLLLFSLGHTEAFNKEEKIKTKKNKETFGEAISNRCRKQYTITRKNTYAVQQYYTVVQKS